MFLRMLLRRMNKANMTHWNHRVVRRVDKFNEGSEAYAIHEVFYDSNGGILTITERPVSPFGETLEELQAELAMFTKAVSLPVIDFDSIGV